MKRIIIWGLSIATLWGACPHLSPKGQPDKTASKEGWTIKIWVIAKGTRSEGRISKLYHHGKAICPVNNKKEIITPFGKLIYQDPSQLWGWHGWKPTKTTVSF